MSPSLDKEYNEQGEKEAGEETFTTKEAKNLIGWIESAMEPPKRGGGI